MLLLLGDQLIRDAGIAVFELVKNAYDADSPTVKVDMRHLQDPERGMIVVQDAGMGMDWSRVVNVWLEPGTDYRAEQRAHGVRTPRFQRLPLGEKGVGRFAAHKLGRLVKLITRAAGHDEVVVEIDWRQFESKRYLSDAQVTVTERTPEVFVGKQTGTRIEIRDLRQAWDRGMARKLHRSITAICSPFTGAGDFQTELQVVPDYGWFDKLLTVDDVLELALFRADCTLEGNVLHYDYWFEPFPGMHRVKARHQTKTMPLPVNLTATEDGHPVQIGSVTMNLYIYDRDPQVLALGVTDKSGLKETLDANGGIRVYRDSVRVYDYGEPGNDWLELGVRRVNTPVKRLSNNLVLGAVSLDLEHSQDLVEKTNREGFVENEAYQIFREAVIFGLQQIEAERNRDKDDIRKAYAKASPRDPVIGAVTALRAALSEKELTKLDPYLKDIEREFLETRDRLMVAAGAGLSLSLVIHEVEKGIAELKKAVERRVSIDDLQALSTHLSELINGLGYLTRSSQSKMEQASTLIKQALFNTQYRLRHHKITVTRGLDLGTPDFQVKCSRRLVIASLMNLFDNAIYWLGVGNRIDPQLYVGTVLNYSGGPAIVVADNGPGFQDPAEYLVQPFYTRKRDGMGLGLHLVNEVMAAQGGKLVFPEPGDVELPTSFNGAVVALVFGGAK